jgi:hypothetical protein
MFPDVQKIFRTYNNFSHSHVLRIHTGKFVGCAEYIRRGVWLCCANFGAELSKFLALLYWRGVAWPTGGVWRGVEFVQSWFYWFILAQIWQNFEIKNF